MAGGECGADGHGAGMSKEDVADVNDGQDVLGIGESNQRQMREVFKAVDVRRFAKSSASMLNETSTKLQVMAAQSVSVSVASSTADAGGAGLELASPGPSMVAEAEHDDIYTAQRSFVQKESRMDAQFKV